MLRDCNLHVSGSKSELIERLNNHEAGAITITQVVHSFELRFHFLLHACVLLLTPALLGL